MYFDISFVWYYVHIIYLETGEWIQSPMTKLLLIISKLIEANAWNLTIFTTIFRDWFYIHFFCSHKDASMWNNYLSRSIFAKNKLNFKRFISHSSLIVRSWWKWKLFNNRLIFLPLYLFHLLVLCINGYQKCYSPVN